MARVTVEDCLTKLPNRFRLIRLATKRARQLAGGTDEPRVIWDNDKPTVVALREIADGFVTEAMYEEVTPVIAERAGTDESDADISEAFASIAAHYASQNAPVSGENEHESDELPPEDH